MRHLPKISLLFLLLLLILSQINAQTITGNGNVIRQVRNVSSFDAIEANNGWDIILSQGNEHKLVVETDENLIETCITEVRGNTLYIYSKRKSWRSSRRNVYVSYKMLKSIDANGGVDISSENTMRVNNLRLDLNGGSDVKGVTMKVDKLEANIGGGSDIKILFEDLESVNIEAHGGSDIRMGGIQGSRLELNLSGGSDAYLEGNVDRLVVDASGGSDLRAGDLKSRSAELLLSGSSDANLYVSDKLFVDLSGGSDASISGRPEVESNTCRSCDLHLR